MLETRVESTSSKDTYKSRISYLPIDELISIEHFSQTGDLLSEIRMTYEEALSYARLIGEVCDEAFSED